jgi:hypothetical protein
MIRPAMFIKVSLALAIALAVASPARAQGLLGMWLDPPDKLVGEALDTAYARAILKTFAASVRRDGDPACLDAKALDDAALVAGGRVLLQRYGVQMMKILDESIEAAVQRFLERHPSPRIVRYLDLLAAAEPVGAQAAAKLGPMVYFAGAERDLAALCVGHR